MSLAALRDAIDLLTTRPVLWIPGALCGIMCALLWLLWYYTGTFFAGKFTIFVLLAAVFLCAMTCAIIRNERVTFGAAVVEGASYYLRVLIPGLVIVFGIGLVFLLVILTLSLIGMPSDPGLLTFLTFGVMLPSIMLGYFADCAAMFEERKVFESIQRSIEIVTINLFETIFFYIGCFLIFCTVSFAFVMIWTMALTDRLEPLTRYNETQIAALTADQLTSLIGPDGIWIAAICIFGAVTVLFPVLMTYKACFYRIFSGTTLPIQQITGEYDSKGRWYKY
jgi:hypothetical protein